MKKYVSIGIMLTLLGGKRVTAPELAQKYETSVKTILQLVVEWQFSKTKKPVFIKGTGSFFTVLSIFDAWLLYFDLAYNMSE